MKKLGVKSTIFHDEDKWVGGFAKKVLGRWYGIQNTSRGCTFISFNSYCHISRGCRKIDFWRFWNFIILGYFYCIFIGYGRKRAPPRGPARLGCFLWFVNLRFFFKYFQRFFMTSTKHWMYLRWKRVGSCRL